MTTGTGAGAAGGDAGGAGAGGAGGAGAGAGAGSAGAGAGAGAGGAPAAFDWAQHGLDQDTLGYVTTKGFKAPGDVPADRILKMPGPDAKPEEIAAYRERLGMPKDAKDYQFAKFEAFGDNKDAEAKFDSFLRTTFHKLGVAAPQAAEFTKEWSAYVKASTEAVAQARQQADLADMTQFKSGLGDKFEKFTNVARQAADAFGLGPEGVDKLASALGFSGTMKFLNAIGSKMGEAEFHGGGGGGNMGSQQAIAEINALKMDASFANRLVNKEAEATAKWDRLHQIAYPQAAA
jgi:hypothetical protein